LEKGKSELKEGGAQTRTAELNPLD
jgi:hypothetical protein